TSEEPDHDHANFTESMRWYYPFLPTFPHRVNAWKRQPAKVDLVKNAGHCVAFEGFRLHPQSHIMRHYIVLSYEHAIEKYVRTVYDLEEVTKLGWCRKRAAVTPEHIKFPSKDKLRYLEPGGRLDPSSPLTEHFILGNPK